MKQKFYGILFLTLGILVLLQLVGNFKLGLAFWPVLLLLLGLVILWESLSYRINSWFLIAIGLWVGAIGLFGILFNAGVTSLDGGDIARYGWPVILVAIGLSILIGDKGWFGRWGACGSWSEDAKGSGCSRMRHIGDLYHGRTSWLLDKDLEFHHGIGDVVIDLTTAELKPGEYKVFIKVGAGEVSVRVPGGVNLDVNATVGVGELNLFGEERSGLGGLSLSRIVEVKEAQTTLNIEAKLGLGDMTVQYMPALPGASQ